MHNSVLNIFYNLPPFSSIQEDQFTSIIQKKIINCYNAIDQIISNKYNSTWNDIYYPLMLAENELNKIWSPLVHLNSVKHNPKLRSIYQSNLSSILEYKNWVNHHRGLYESYRKFKNNDSYRFLSIIEKSALNKILLQYELSGIYLSYNKKKRYQHIISQLSKLNINYINNVLDSTLSWKKLITDKRLLSGIPDNILNSSKLIAKSNNKIGWLFTLQSSNYESILSYCDNPEFRKEFYWAFNTRASDQGPNKGQWDNTIIMNEILSLRHESAQLLGFNNYFEKTLKTKMAQNPKQVFNFLINLSNHISQQANKEFSEIQKFAQKYYSHPLLNPWDIAYYKKKQKNHLNPTITEIELSHYFPINQVLKGMFAIAKYIYNIIIKKRNNVDIWHPDVQFFDIFDNKNQWKGGFYLDLYFRDNKQDGAWMNVYTDMMYYKNKNAQYQRPIAYLICNFNYSFHNENSEISSFLTHNDVITLFHEFGHVLHHILTSINIPIISGIHSVSEDSVEIPSQFMEKFCWEPSTLKLISMHYKTKQPLSDDTINNFLKLKMHHSPLDLLNQIIYGLFDFKIHHEYNSINKIDILKTYNTIIRHVSPFYPIEYTDRFPNSFTHIFSDDNYAAGYYGYLWSDTIASHIWNNLEKSQLLNIKTGKLLLNNMFNLSILTNLNKNLYSTLTNTVTTKSIFKYYNIPIFNKNFFKLF